MATNSYVNAWFDERHGDALRRCPRCGATSRRPCTAMVRMFGTGVADGMELRGMHVERLSPTRLMEGARGD